MPQDIRVLRCGTRPTAASILFHRDPDPNTVCVQFQCWLVVSGSHRILIDVGLPSGDERLAAIDQARTSADLAEFEIDPKSITDVVLTHLHWDHVGDVDLFTNAAIHVQEQELAFLRSGWFQRDAVRPLFAHQSKLEWITDNPRLHRVDQEARVASGVQVRWVGGHTPGSQIALVDTGAERYVFTGDVINVRRNLDADIPAGITWSLPQALDALQTVRDLEQDGYLAVPAHDTSSPLDMTGDSHGQ